MSLRSNPLLVPRLSQVRIQILWPQEPHIVSFRHLTVCFSVQPLARLLSSTITTCFPSFPRFRTRSPTRPWVATPARQTTLTLTTCHGASRSSKRRPNVSKPHVCPTVCPLDGISRRRRKKEKKKALVRLFTHNLHWSSDFLITSDIGVRFLPCGKQNAPVSFWWWLF